MSAESKRLEESLSFLSPIKLDEGTLRALLIRVGGFIEAMESLKKNPEIADRLNVKSVNVIQQLAQCLLGAHSTIADLQDRNKSVIDLHKRCDELAALCASQTDKASSLEEENEKLKSEIAELKLRKKR